MAKRTGAKRELIETGSDKRYVRRTLPEKPRSRTYEVTIAPSRFGDSFDPAVMESVAPEGHVAFAGSATLLVVDPLRSVVAPFTGSIEYCVNPDISEDGYRCTPPLRPVARCDSASHQLKLTRR